MKLHTSLVVILDRSGSMTSMKADVEGGFDRLIKEQVDGEGTCDVTLVQFDTEGVETVYSGKPIAQVESLVLEPRGGTPLLDAIGTTIGNVDVHLSGLGADRKPDRVLVIIVTDGYENASREYTRPQIKTLIEQHEKDKDWKFVYVGANVDAFAEAGSIGIAAAATSGYLPDNVGAAFVACSDNMNSYRKGATFSFSNTQRSDMGSDSTPMPPPIPPITRTDGKSEETSSETTVEENS
jgi:uncharacterized protein YegL